MNAVLKTPPDLLEAQFDTLVEHHLDAVLAIEQRVYSHPWSWGNFTDSIKAGYQAQVLMAGSTLIGYFVAMKGVEEVHLLNITVAPAHQRQGWARVMLDALALWSRGQGAKLVWLEVRASNTRAHDVYKSHGYQLVGGRKAYYPAAADGRREDALVMSLTL